MVSLDIGRASDKGNKRDNNQDSGFIMHNEKFAVFVLADGMGGMNHGEIASKMVTDNIRLWLENNIDEISKMPIDMLTDIFYEKINIINRKLVDYCQQKNMKTGTTLTVFIINRNNRGAVFYSGDTRMYCIRESKVSQLTEDETLYNYYEKINFEKNSARNKSILTSFVGKSKNFLFSIKNFDVKKGDIYVLCTDGFYNYFNIYEDKNLNTLQNNTSQQSIYEFFDHIKSSTEAADNLSAIIIKCV